MPAYSVHVKTMKPYAHLVLAVDFTPSCLNALRQAARLAAPLKARITAVHVMDEFLVHELKRALSTDQASIRADWTAKLRKFLEDAELGMPDLEVQVRIGHPFTELVDACRVEGADLLVMGVKGSRLDPHRVGAIATQCVRKSPIDVLLVREDAWGAYKHLATCVDFSENSAVALQRAAQVAELEGATLNAVHVYQSALAMSIDYGGLISPMPIGADDGSLEHWEKELETFVSGVTQAYPSVPCMTHVIERINIRETILEHVKTTHADLVVLGTRGRTGLRELLIGTTAEKIVAHAPCSILVVKPEVLPTGEA